MSYTTAKTKNKQNSKVNIQIKLIFKNIYTYNIQ